MKKKVVEGNVLAEGEVTGHKHKVTVQVLERTDQLREFVGPTIVTHEEHNPVEIKANRKFVSGIVTEVDHTTGAVVRVRD
jgi:hypothetical protein